MTTKDNSFNSSDIDYLESRLIELAVRAGTSDSDNKKKGNPKKVDEFREAELEQYLDEALFLLELIGVRVFIKETKKPVKLEKPPFESKASSKKPPLPDEKTLGPCAFAKQALLNLIDAGYLFSDKQMEQYSTVDGSRQFTKRNLPLFYILKDGETRDSCEKSIRERYWKDEFQSGKYRFLMYSQWYENPKNGATKEELKNWYNTL